MGPWRRGTRYVKTPVLSPHLPRSDDARRFACERLFAISSTCTSTSTSRIKPRSIGVVVVKDAFDLLASALPLRPCVHARCTWRTGW